MGYADESKMQSMSKEELEKGVEECLSYEDDQ
jgi:hypothetical protein